MATTTAKAEKVFFIMNKNTNLIDHCSTFKFAKHITIVRSNIKSLSSMSQESCDSMYRVLSRFYTRVTVVEVNQYSDLTRLIRLNPDVVFLGMEYVPLYDAQEEHNEIYISDYLDKHGIAYVGSAGNALSLGRHKVLAKRHMKDVGINTPDFSVIRKGEIYDYTDISLSYPIFIKPAYGGGGYGVDSLSLVHNLEQLKSKVSYITSVLKTDALLEEYLPGREFSVAMIYDDQTKSIKALPIELIAPEDANGNRMLSNSVKSTNSEEVKSLDDVVLKNKLSEFSVQIFEAFGARDYGRIDIRLDSSGKPHFLEVNLIPSLIKGYGSFPKSCLLNMKLGYEDMILTLISNALRRIPKDTDRVKASHYIPTILRSQSATSKV